MGIFRKPQKQDFPDLPDNLYFARLAKITEKVGVQSGKPYTSWGFEIVQPPFQKRWVFANTQPTVSPKSQAGRLLTSLGVDLNTFDPTTFNEQTLVGTYIKVLVETTENKDGDKFQNVTKLMPILDSEQPLLQQFLAQLEVKGAVKVASASQNPTAPHVPQQPVLAAAPVSLPAAPAQFPGFTAPAAVATPAPAPVAQPAPAPVAAASAPKSKFPF